MAKQCERLLSALRNGPMTTLEIEVQLGIGRPAAVVLKLKNNGHNIITTMVDRKNRIGEDTRVAEYTLVAADAKAAA